MTHPKIVEARRLHSAGDSKRAHDTLVAEIFSHGWQQVLQDELNRLFPITPAARDKLTEYRTRLVDPDAKIRKKAATEISRLALGTHSNVMLEFIRFPEAISLLMENLANEDLVVQENMTIALAQAFWGYTRDQRAFQPLLLQLKSKSVNTRAWAIQALANLSDESVEYLIPLTRDKTERVRNEAFGHLSFMLDGGGVLIHPPMGHSGRMKIRDAFLTPNLDADVDSRISAASLLAAVALLEDLPVLQNWMKKDRSQVVKQRLQAGIERLQSPPEPAEPKAVPVKKAANKPAKKSPPTSNPKAPDPDPAFLPFKLHENTTGGLHSLMLTEFGSSADIFEELGNDGGGYGWHGVADALIRWKAPKLAKIVDFDCEASMFVALSANREALHEVAALLRAAMNDPKLLKQAIKKANPKLMD